MEELLQQSAERLVQRFANDLLTLSLTKYGAATNTGSAARSVAFTLTKTGYLITGNDYIQQLVFGREPGKQPPLSAIEEWMKEKGLEGSAFPIARAIAKKGTVIFQTHKGEASGLFEKAIQEESETLSKLLAGKYTELIIQSILD